MIRRERREQREDIEIERKETKRNLVTNLKRRIRNIDTCLCLFPQGTAFLLSSRLDSAVKRCSSEVLKFSFPELLGKGSGSVKGLARRN